MIPEDPVLVIDCQVFQSSTWRHGIGQYSMALLTALARLPDPMPYGAVHLLFNSTLEVGDDRVTQLRTLFPTAAVDHVQLRHDRTSPLAAGAANRAALDRHLEAFTTAQIDYLMPAMFLPEGAAAFPSRSRKLLIIYDLIPLLFHQRYKYLNKAHFDDYLSRFGALYQADVILTISQTTADDLQVYLGIPAEKLLNIDGAAIDLKATPAVRPEVSIGGPYLLAPTGGEQRKNITRAVTAFDRVARARGERLRLVLTSLFDDDLRTHLESLSADLVFTGHVTSSELSWLYENALGVLFPSEYEGLGLPVLEAVASDKPVACSDIPVMREISPSAFYMFDPLSVDSIANAIESCLGGVGWASRRTEYPSLRKRYTWDRTSARVVARLADQTRPSPRLRPRPRIAVVTPDLSGCSPVSALNIALHPALAEECEPEYFLDRSPTGEEARPNPLQGAAPCHDARDFTGARYSEFEAVIYHLGGAEPQVRTLLSALHLPGYVVLHGDDLTVSFQAAVELGLMSAARLELERSLGAQASAGRGGCLGSVLSAQLGAVAHSERTGLLADAWLRDGAQCLRLDLPTAVPVRAAWDARPRVLRVGAWSDTGCEAQIAEVRAATAGGVGPDSLVTVFTGCLGRAPVQAGRASDRVALGNDLAFQTALSRQDVLVMLEPLASDVVAAVVADALRYGVVVVLEDSTWSLDLAATGLVRISNRADLAATLARLAAAPESLRRMGEAARARMADRSYGRYADALLGFIGASEGASRGGVNRLQAEALRAGLDWRRVWAHLHDQ